MWIQGVKVKDRNTGYLVHQFGSAKSNLCKQYSKKSQLGGFRTGASSRVKQIASDPMKSNPQPLILATIGYRFDTATKELTRIGDQIHISVLTSYANRLNDLNGIYSLGRKGEQL